MKCLDIQVIIKNYASVINQTGSLASNRRRPQACVHLVWATSSKLQAASLKLQAASIKPQAQRLKLKATSNKLADHGPWKKFHGARTEVLNADKGVVWMPLMKGYLVW